MNEEKITFLSYEQAITLVAAIQEEEDIDNPDRRVLTVYGHDDQPICWFDFDETMAAVGTVEKSQLQEAVQNYILTHLPDWALDE